jgi:hypothetical protein
VEDLNNKKAAIIPIKTAIGDGNAKIMQYDTGTQNVKIKQTKESRHMDSLFF